MNHLPTYPGVPQAVDMTSPLPSILERPKSLIMIFDSSWGLKYSKFSGWRERKRGNKMCCFFLNSFFVIFKVCKHLGWKIKSIMSNRTASLSIQQSSGAHLLPHCFDLSPLLQQPEPAPLTHNALPVSSHRSYCFSKSLAVKCERPAHVDLKCGRGLCV